MIIGEIIHRKRKEKNMTLVELSDKSGVALATLSRIENCKMTGTIDSHMKICQALEISLPDMYRELTLTKKEVDVQTKKSKTDVFLHDDRAASEVLVTKMANKKMLPILIKLAKGGTTLKEETRIGVEKFLYVLEGKIEASIGDEKYTLTKGDTLYFDSSIPHQIKNLGAGEARLITVTCPPIL
jgi:quercetin dioxygenase-like cupin family protein/DNA-binding Xre family transcriptional regulator